MKLLQSRDYPSDPVKKWKQSVSDEEEEGEGEGEGDEGDEGREEGAKGQGEADYNYLLSMSLWSLTLEKKEELIKKRDEKVSVYNIRYDLLSTYNYNCVLPGSGVDDIAGQDSKGSVE